MTMAAGSSGGGFLFFPLQLRPSVRRSGINNPSGNAHFCRTSRTIGFVNSISVLLGALTGV